MGVVLPIGARGALLVGGRLTDNGAPRRKPRTGEEFQPQSRGEVERCIILWHGSSCRRQGSIRNGHKFNFAIESGDLCPQETMAVVNSKTAIRADSRTAV